MKTYIVTVLLSFTISLVFHFILIPILRKMKAGQNILVYVKEHKNKSGTPTMGGIAFVAAAVLSAALFIPKISRSVLLSIVIGVSYMVVGLLDDVLKQKHKENLGLKAWQKFSFQAVIALFSAGYCYNVGLTQVYIPFLGRVVELGGWIFPLTVFVFVATVNAVNLTDGLDGLAAGSALPFFVALGVIIVLQGNDGEFATLSFALAGALMAYLLFNVSKASVFMGDTGSLALGGFAASIGIFSRNVLYIAVLGLVFVFSVISVIVQVIYYKVTGGKRIFLMSPVHHHFQMKGYSESKIAYAYAVVTLIMGLLCVLNV